MEFRQRDNLGRLKELVERVKPHAILVLDTNVLMRNPAIQDYFADVKTPLILVVPIVVHTELIALTEGAKKPEETKEKARQALQSLDALFDKGDASCGISLQTGHWIVTLRSPRLEMNKEKTPEEELLRATLHASDLAILQMALDCCEGFEGCPALLLSNDHHLSMTSKAQGLRVSDDRCLADPALLTDKLAGLQPARKSVEELMGRLDEWRTVHLSMTLQELRSDKDMLIATIIGAVTEEGERYPFRCVFSFKNGDKVKGADGYFVRELDNVVPVENLDFFGREERVSHQLRSKIADSLDEATNGTGGMVSGLRPLYEKVDDLDAYWRSMKHTFVPSLQSPQYLIRCHLWDEFSIEYEPSRPETGTEVRLLYDSLLKWDKKISEPLPFETFLERYRAYNFVTDEVFKLAATPTHGDIAPLPWFRRYGYLSHMIYRITQYLSEATGGVLFPEIYPKTAGFVPRLKHEDDTKFFESFLRLLDEELSGVESILREVCDLAGQTWKMGETIQGPQDYLPYLLPEPEKPSTNKGEESGDTP